MGLGITDYRLPDLSRTDLVCRMKHLEPERPIVLFTELLDPQPGFEQANQVLTKGSMTPPEFLDRIASLLSKEKSAA